MVDEKVNGIDRKDSTKGYSIDNCVPCCPMCNKMKQTFTEEEFLNQIAKIYNKLISQGSETISKESTSQAYGGGSGKHLVKDGDIVQSHR